MEMINNTGGALILRFLFETIDIRGIPNVF